MTIIAKDQSSEVEGKVPFFSYSPNFSLLRGLSERLSRRFHGISPGKNDKCQVTDINSETFEKIIRSKLDIMLDSSLFEDVTIEEDEDEHQNEGSVEENLPIPDCKGPEDIKRNIWKWRSIFCCWGHASSTPAPIPEVGEVPVVHQPSIKMRTVGIQTEFNLMKWPIFYPPPVVAESKKENKPQELLSRRGDIPVVVSNERKPKFCRGSHQYYRGSWKLKPSVIGAPETLGQSAD